MTREPFDRSRRRQRRDRAARSGIDLFLLDRAFDDCVERAMTTGRRFRRALLVGAAGADWPTRLETIADVVDVFDPSPLLASAHGDEDRHDFGEERYDLVVACGTLDSVNDLPVAFQLLRRSMVADAPLVGAMAGGDTLPRLRASLVEAERASGRIAARTHPRIDAPTLTQLLAASGLQGRNFDQVRPIYLYHSVNALRQTGQDYLARMIAAEALART